MTRVLAIDPGNTESAYVAINSDRRPVFFDKVPNSDLVDAVAASCGDEWYPDRIAIEMVASYGMPVGADVFETCVWIGRFYETVRPCPRHPELVKRLPVKMHFCHDSKAKDPNVRRALVDRFAHGVRNYGKGSKDAPGWFYGFHRDIWQAYALAVYIADTQDGPACSSAGPASRCVRRSPTTPQRCSRPTTGANPGGA